MHQGQVVEAGDMLRVIGVEGRAGDDLAQRTDRLFGLLLADAAKILFRRAHSDGCGKTIPVRLAGGPANALDCFGPAAAAEMQAHGLQHALEPSAIMTGNENPNLIGALVLATQAETRAGFAKS